MTLVPGDDRGLLLGDGLFETILVKAGRPVLWAAHIDRMRRGCVALGLPSPDEQALADAADQALVAADLGDTRAALRLTLTAGSGGRGLDRPDAPQPRLLASAAPAPRQTRAARLHLSAVRRNAGSPASQLKTLAYLDNVLARREARQAGCDEALMLNGQGRLAGCAAANLFWIAGGRLYTPALSCGVLDGIMRGEVIAAAGALGPDCAEIEAGLEALAAAEAVFVTNSLTGVRPVSGLGDQTWADHPLVRALDQACALVS